jgi:hypothetical protein
MTDPTIRAALEAAGEAARVAMAQDGTCPSLGGFVCTSPPCRCARDASAAAVAAFLRHMAPEWRTEFVFTHLDGETAGSLDFSLRDPAENMADAVEQAAKEGEP